MVAHVQRVGIRNIATVIAAAVGIFVTACGGGDAGVPGEPGASSIAAVGQVSQALGTPPESNCTGLSKGGHDYWFCSALRNWSTARTKCEAQGYNLVRIEDADENNFVKSHIGLDAWMGGNDATTEGTWVWTFGGSNFWIGTASGHSANGLFNNWNSGQPDNLGNQDCGKMTLDGTWRDDLCALSLRYVCESGPDQCPNDPNKVVPGLCNCGVADVDTDVDGTPDCKDQCPNDATKIRPGDCGCSNAPRATGTPCSDGLCAANTACNGAGVCGNPASCPAPDTNCTFGAFQNNYYWFCGHDQTFANGRQRCQSVGMDLTAIESAPEDKFITSKASAFDHVFIGATDEATSGTWVWKSTGQQFWSGGPTGSPTAGAYANWEQGQPNDVLSTRRCAQKDPGINGGLWETRSCALPEGYICERDDLCPFDPLKTAPGFCDCGRPETNTDGDALPDCVDECPTDPNKTKRGINGCGVSDNDVGDNDGVPPPLDELPNNPKVQQAGMCGKPGSFQPASTPCNDGVCPVIAACDGAGLCGDPTACPPPNGGTCTARQVQGKTYWFCTGPVTRAQAAASCRSRPGQSLVQIETAQENALLSALITTDSWIGANDLATDGDWRWATASQDGGEKFWSGGASGSRYFGAYAAWKQGQPGGAAGEACADMLFTGTDRGTWDDLACSSTRGFVCEVATGGPPIDDGITPPARQPCVPLATEFPTVDLTTDAGIHAVKAQVTADTHACQAACPQNANPNDPVAQAACVDACNATTFLQPGPDGDHCADWDQNANTFCDIETPSTAPPTPCTADRNCPSPFRCGFFNHTGRGVSNGGQKFCGTPRGTCPTIPDPNFAGRCADHAAICAPPSQTQTTQRWDNPTALNPETFDGNTFFGTATEPIGDYVSGTQTPCPPTGNPPTPGSCINKGTAHPWCHYAPNQALRHLDDVTHDNTATASGDSKLVTFDFDPKLKLQFASEVGALGLPIPDVHAQAGVEATVHVSKKLVPGGATLHVVNVLAAVDGTKCSIGTSKSHATLFDIDFVPNMHRVNEGGFDSTVCEKAYSAFAEATDRTNKAMRDAQALLQQYYDAIAAGQPLKKICQDLTASAPVGFPAPEGACADEMPAKTIGRFIDYYQRTINGIPSAPYPTLAPAAEALRNATPDGPPIDLFSLASGSEESTIASAQFFIGPIPVLLEVYGTISYGVDLAAVFSYAPGAFIADSLLNPNVIDPHKVAFIGVQGGPKATAKMGLFAGAGFNIGVAEAKFGVSAELNLVTIELPAHAGAGLFLSSDPDLRPQPDDVGDPVLHAAGNRLANAIPPRKYSARVGYAVKLEAKTNDILSGSVNAELALEFLFFSLSWRQELFNFTGFCGNVGDEKCTNVIFQIQGDPSAPRDAAWDKVQMPTPLPTLIPPEFFANTALPAGTKDVDLSQIDQLFYDTECICAEINRLCQVSEDCCDFTQTVPALKATCFSDPENGIRSCQKCRGAGRSCNADTDCCDGQFCGTDNLHPFPVCKLLR